MPLESRGVQHHSPRDSGGVRSTCASGNGGCGTSRDPWEAPPLSAPPWEHLRRLTWAVSYRRERLVNPGFQRGSSAHQGRKPGAWTPWPHVDSLLGHQEGQADHASITTPQGEAPGAKQGLRPRGKGGAPSFPSCGTLSESVIPCNTQGIKSGPPGLEAETAGNKSRWESQRSLISVCIVDSIRKPVYKLLGKPHPRSPHLACGHPQHPACLAHTSSTLRPAPFTCSWERDVVKGWGTFTESRSGRNHILKLQHRSPENERLSTASLEPWAIRRHTSLRILPQGKWEVWSRCVHTSCERASESIEAVSKDGRKWLLPQMWKQQHEMPRNVNNQGNVTSPKDSNNFPVSKSKYVELHNVLNKELQITVLRKPELQENPERQVNEITKTVYEQNEKNQQRERNYLKRTRKKFWSWRTQRRKWKLHRECQQQNRPHRRRICELEERNLETTQTQKNKEERVKESEESLGELWDTAKEPIYELLEFQKEKKGRGEKKTYLKEKWWRTYQTWGKKSGHPRSWRYRSPHYFNPKWSFLRYTMKKLFKNQRQRENPKSSKSEDCNL